jgi:hypothetical protein
VGLKPGADIGGGVGGEVVQHDMDLGGRRVGATALFRKARNAVRLRDGKQSPITSPMVTFRAANRLVVRCRT